MVAGKYNAWLYLTHSKFEKMIAQRSEAKRLKRNAESQADRPASDFTHAQCGRDCPVGGGGGGKAARPGTKKQCSHNLQSDPLGSGFKKRRENFPL